MRPPLRPLVVLALVAALVLPAAPARADIQQALNLQLNALTTLSQPGVYEGAMARTATGGYLRVRNRITNLNVVGFQPPSFSAGCGGIDFFGGSFSFINAAQFTQLLRTIAANAAGYAFAIALEQLCPICMKTIAMLQKLIQDMNAMLGNSCQ
ncbi:MAG: conjugal transfer protein, partial [Geminicoccaceae bacterium]